MRFDFVKQRIRPRATQFFIDSLRGTPMLDTAKKKPVASNTKKPNPIDIHVGGRVRLKRMMLGMSQEKLGDQLGITFQQIQKYEKGTNRVGASRLQNIATVLSVPVGFFFDGAPGNSPSSAADAKSGSYVVDFLSSSEGLQLNRSFVRIGDSKVRKRIVDLVRSLAGDGIDN
jgi:transcriptional regulator with XRE-family HTH domain